MAIITIITTMINNNIFLYSIINSLEHSFNFFLEALPYILFGFILSSYIKVKLKGNIRKKLVHKLGNNKKSLILSSFVGGILPLCSASGVPVANTLNSKGANLGVAMAFIVSASSINPISIMLSYSLLGYKLVILQIISSIILSILVGLVFYNDKVKIYYFEENIVKNDFLNIFLNQSKKLFPSILLGFLISGFIMEYVPKDTILLILSNNIYNYFYVSILRIFIFLCPNALIPIIKSVAVNGISKGLIISFLISAPTIGLPLVLALNRSYGKKIVIKYLISVILISGLIGIGLDKIYIF